MSQKSFGPSEAVDEKSDLEYSCQFVESTIGQPVLNAAAITTIVATLKDVATSTLAQADAGVLNGRYAQDVKNANGGVLASDGLFTLHLAAADNLCIGASPNGLEQHRLTLNVTYTRTGGGVGVLNHEVRFYVRNLHDVTGGLVALTGVSTTGMVGSVVAA